MRNILCLIGLVLGLTAFSQNQTATNLRVRNSIRLVDSTVTVMGKDTLTSPAMVRQLISEGAGYTASNGITKVGSDFKLGSLTPLTGNTFIFGGSYNFEIGQPASLVGEFDVWADDDINLNTNQLNIVVPTYEWNFLGKTIEGSDGDNVAYESYVQSYNLAQQKSAPFIFLYENQGVTSNARPGSGYYATNSATASLITQIYIDDYDQNTVDKQSFLQLADTGSYFYIQEKGVTTAYYMYQIESFADSSGWTVYNVDYTFHTGNIATIDDIELVLELNNNTGGAGGGGGLIDSIYVSGQDEWVGNTDTISYVDTSNISKKLVTSTTEINDVGIYGDDNVFRLDNSNGTGYIQALFRPGSDDSFIGTLNNTANTYNNQIGFYNNIVTFGIAYNSESYYRPYFFMSATQRLMQMFVYDGDIDHGDGIIINGVDKNTKILADHGTYDTRYVFDTNSVDFRIDNVLTYEFGEDSLKAPNIVAQFKEINSLEKLISDTNIVGGDTITGGISLKDAVEAETFDSININGYVIKREPSRLMMNFSDSAYVVTIASQDVPVQVGGDSLWSIYRNTGTYTYTIQNDSVQLPIPGSIWYTVSGDLSFYGANADQYIWHVYIDGIELTNQGKFVRGMTTTNRGVSSFQCAFQGNQNSWVSFYLENVGSAGDPTLVSSNISIISD